MNESIVPRKNCTWKVRHSCQTIVSIIAPGLMLPKCKVLRNIWSIMEGVQILFKIEYRNLKFTAGIPSSAAWWENERDSNQTQAEQ